jgi:hypothetical protein
MPTIPTPPSSDPSPAAAPTETGCGGRLPTHTSEPSSWECLLAGVDTLDLGLYIRWDNQWEFHVARLEAWKARAAGTPGLLIEDGLLPVGQAVILPGGKPPMFRYHMQLPEFHVFFSRSDTYRAGPNVYVSVTAETLWRLGATQAVSLVWGLMEDLGGTVDRIQPSRVDLCADFLIPGGLTLDFLRHHRVSRSRATRHFETADTLETYYVGSGQSPITARIYDKGREIQKSHKQWFLPLWKRADGTDVWRVEFQLRRTALKAFRIDTMDALREKMAGLWQGLTTGWLSFRLHDAQHPTRRTVHLWWAAVAVCAERFGEPIEVDRFASPPSDSAEWHEKHIAGCLSSFAAITNLGSFQAALDSLAQRLTDQVDPEEFRDCIALKSIKLGKHPPAEAGGAMAPPPSGERETL